MPPVDCKYLISICTHSNHSSKDPYQTPSGTMTPQKCRLTWKRHRSYTEWVFPRRKHSYVRYSRMMLCLSKIISRYYNTQTCNICWKDKGRDAYAGYSVAEEDALWGAQKGHIYSTVDHRWAWEVLNFSKYSPRQRASHHQIK
jgi:hypothetical protein